MDEEKLERLRKRIQEEREQDKIVHIPITGRTDDELLAEIDEWLRKQGI